MTIMWESSGQVSICCIFGTKIYEDSSSLKCFDIGAVREREIVVFVVFLFNLNWLGTLKVLSF